MYTTKHAVKTDVGQKRKQNEDNFAVVPQHNLYVVTDGMGGHAKGDVASALIAETTRHIAYHVLGDDPDPGFGPDPEATWPERPAPHLHDAEAFLWTVARHANYKVWHAGQMLLPPHERGRRGAHNMGATFVGMYYSGGKVAAIAWVGDSRIYRYSPDDGELVQLTTDHSMVEDFKRQNPDAPEEELNVIKSRYGNVISRACGLRESVEVDTLLVKVHAGDIFLLCSDGLTGELTDGELAHWLKLIPQQGLQGACDALVDAANAMGGKDNITCCLVEFQG